MTYDCVGILGLTSQIPIYVTALGIHYSSSSYQSKNFLERFRLVKALMTFHHDVQNSHVPDFLELLVNPISKTSLGEFAKQTYKSYTAPSEHSLYLLLSDT